MASNLIVLMDHVKLILLFFSDKSNVYILVVRKESVIEE